MSASRSGPPGSAALLSAQWRKGLHQRGQVTKLLRVVGHLRPWHRIEGVRNEDREGRKGPVALRRKARRIPCRFAWTESQGDPQSRSLGGFAHRRISGRCFSSLAQPSFWYSSPYSSVPAVVHCLLTLLSGE